MFYLVPNRSLPSLPVATGTWHSLPWIFFLPFISIWNFICGFFGGTQIPTNDTPSAIAPVPGRSSSQSRPEYSRDGNVMRFRGQDKDSDDENNTWNGNSTQQM